MCWAGAGQPGPIIVKGDGLETLLSFFLQPAPRIGEAEPGPREARRRDRESVPARRGGHAKAAVARNERDGERREETKIAKRKEKEKTKDSNSLPYNREPPRGRWNPSSGTTTERDGGGGESQW